VSTSISFFRLSNATTLLPDLGRPPPGPPLFAERPVSGPEKRLDQLCRAPKNAGPYHPVDQAVRCSFNRCLQVWSADVGPAAGRKRIPVPAYLLLRPVRACWTRADRASPRIKSGSRRPYAYGPARARTCSKARNFSQGLWTTKRPGSDFRVTIPGLPSTRYPG